MSRKMSRQRAAAVVVGAALSLTVALAVAVPVTGDRQGYLPKPRFNERGALLRPEGYREWVHVGTPLTPDSLNPPKAAFSEFHNVYIHPEDFQTYKETGVFPDGTVLVKELITVGSTQAASGNGFFMGEFAGLEAAMKDSKRFPQEPGHWAYFSFGHEHPLADSAEAFPTAACNACHEPNAQQDWVFTQYYPVLRGAKNAGASAFPTWKMMDTHDVHEATCPICRSGLKRFAAIEIEPAGPGGEIGGIPLSSDKLFEFLQRGEYESWEHEADIQEPRGPHDDGITFVNPSMQEALHGRLGVMPVGAAAVREMYKDAAQYGWAVSIKTQADSADGDNWYWYEVLSTTDGSRLAAAGMGVPLCTSCHRLGRDFVLAKPVE